MNKSAYKRLPYNKGKENEIQERLWHKNIYHTSNKHIKFVKQYLNRTPRRKYKIKLKMGCE